VEPPAPSGDAKQRLRQATSSIEKKLDEPTKFDFADLSLADVVANLAKEHDLRIVLDPLGLELAGVTADQLISLKLEGVSLRSGLRTLLKPLQLTFVVGHEVVQITSLDVPERLAMVRTFPLGSLEERLDDPSELVTTLEMVWPAVDDRVGEFRLCQPRARIVAGHLVVRGSPRHLELAEQLIDGLQEGGGNERSRVQRIELPTEKPMAPSVEPRRTPPPRRPLTPPLPPPNER
jgi:hypothetical protein